MPGAHAILSPSSAKRWLTCNPSARMEMQYPESTSEVAAEGTLAHRLAEIMLQLKTDRITVHKFNSELKKIKKNPLYNKSMQEYVDDYVTYVLEHFYAALEEDTTAELHLEKRFDLTAYIPEGFGTNDVSIIYSGTLNIIDLKYGKGVRVDAERNHQCMIYALGALREFDDLGFYGIENVIMTIYQPRIDNVSTYEMAALDLTAWGDFILKPGALQAYKGEGEFIPGDHCQFCRVKDCAARAEHNLKIAQYDFAKPNVLTEHQIADILERKDELMNWARSVAEFALTEAVKGKQYPGFKVVSGRSNRAIVNPEALAGELQELGYGETDLYKKEMVSLTALEELIGKKTFSDKFAEFITKPFGSPTLVPESDKRLPYGLASALDDFADPFD